MKLFLSSLIAGVVCLAFFVASPSMLPAQNQNQNPGQTVIQRQSIEGRIEQYKVIDISTIPVTRANTGAAGTLELVLNELAVDGWRLREATGNFLIFVR